MQTSPVSTVKVLRFNTQPTTLQPLCCIKGSVCSRRSTAWIFSDQQCWILVPFSITITLRREWPGGQSGESRQDLNFSLEVSFFTQLLYLFFAWMSATAPMLLRISRFISMIIVFHPLSMTARFFALHSSAVGKSYKPFCLQTCLDNMLYELVCFKHTLAFRISLFKDWEKNPHIASEHNPTAVISKSYL